ncbi:DUF6920 family protein [Candidatus Nitrosocosmicus hydrocola]|uniref:DUF6920 family protein n=1 Tax=Candidatus Nitrosocosmicus hydrocola TaxID=1826872 RepID=UPI0011E5F7CF|nr:DUF6544 family protein [Candidatus Nitrosocosmicus hydrocola]
MVIFIALFNSHLKESIKKLSISSKNTSYSQFSFTQIESLPSPVQRYFRYSLNQGQHYISDARLIHDGEFRQNEHQKWMPIRGEEYFSTEQPGFVWLGKIQLLPFIWITGLDELIDGQGKFQIKLMSHITIAEAPKGRKLDEGELMRWLGETPLFPTALLPSKYLKWEDVDSNSSKAVVNYDELAVNLIFYFNESGEIIKMEGNRYRSINDSYVKEKWVGYYSNYTKIENMMVPLALEVAWNTQAGIFSYAKFNIKEIFYNFQKY